MKYRFTWLLLVLLLAMSNMTLAAENEEMAPAPQSELRPLFDNVAPLRGAFSISADGRISAHIGANGDVVIWNTAHVKPLEIITSREKKPSAIALNSDGNMVAIGYPDSRLVVRYRLHKKPLREFYGHSGAISALAFSSDGKTLASGADDGTTQLWSMATGRRLRIFDSMYNGELSGRSGVPVSIGFSSHGKVLLVNEQHYDNSNVHRRVTFWDIRDGIEISTRAVAHPSSDYSMRAGLGGNGWLLAYTGGWLSGRAGLMVERLDGCESPLQLPFEGYADTVSADPLGRWVAASGLGNITFLDLNGNKKEYDLPLLGNAIALVPHPDGRSVFALMYDNKQRFGDDRFYGFIFGSDTEPVVGIGLYRIPVPEQFWRSPSLNVKAGAGHCPLTEIERRQQAFKLPEKPFHLKTIAKLLPTKDMTANMDVPNGENLQVNPPKELYFGQDDNLYALYYAESNFRSGVAVWDLQTNRFLRGQFTFSPIQIIRMREGWACGQGSLTNLLSGKPFLSFSNDDGKSQYFKTISDPETGQFFRLATRHHVERYRADGGRMQDMEIGETLINFAVRNGRLAVLEQDGNVQVFQLEPPGESKTYKLKLDPDGLPGAGDMALSADGRYLRIDSAKRDGDLHDVAVVYNLRLAQPAGEGKMLTPFPDYANRGVVADTRQHRLAVWDYDKAQIIARLPRHRSRDKSGASQQLLAALSENGRLVASGSQDGLIRVWDIEAHQLIGEGRMGGEVTAIAFDSTAQRLAAGRKDGRIIVFQITSPN